MRCAPRMSVPGLMAPVKDGDRLLVDGGLVDNVPIDEVRDRCKPDVVIAVNVGSPLMKAKDIGGIFSVAGQMINILTEQNVTRSLATSNPGISTSSRIWKASPRRNSSVTRRRPNADGRRPKPCCPDCRP
jgi:predicted acylesterase/phospholipase RssA